MNKGVKLSNCKRKRSRDVGKARKRRKKRHGGLGEGKRPRERERDATTDIIFLYRFVNVPGDVFCCYSALRCFASIFSSIKTLTV